MQCTIDFGINIILCTYNYFPDQLMQVLPSVTRINGNNVAFDDGKMRYFDAIVFATGYRSTVKNWLKVKVTVVHCFSTINIISTL